MRISRQEVCMCMECDPKGGEKGKGKREDRTTNMQSVEDHFKRPFIARYRLLLSFGTVFPDARTPCHRPGRRCIRTRLQPVFPNTQRMPALMIY